MNSFARLLESLIFSPRRSVKQAHLVDWIAQTEFPDRGWGLAALIGELDFPAVKAGIIRELAADTTDKYLFELSYDFVGDLAETVALLWPEGKAADRQEGSKDEDEADIASLTEIVDSLSSVSRAEAKPVLASYLDQMNLSQRWTLLKLATGGMRVGLSARMARLAIAEYYRRDIAEIEEIWPLLSPPYAELFDWLEGRTDRPSARGRAVFRPMMLAHPVDDASLDALSCDDWQIEWKWDGARIQLVSAEDGVRLFSRSGDDMSASFPELVAPMGWKGVLDGEILAGRPDEIDSFNALQKRLNRKTASVKMQQANPVFLRFYDIMFVGETDLRALPLSERRERLEVQTEHIDHPHFDISPILQADDVAHLARLRDECRQSRLIEGLMLKAKDSTYQAGRIKGAWYKWKRDPLLADLVMMYAQRGHGKRSSFYSDYSFGAWKDTEDGQELVPVAKAYSGFTDAELKKLDKFVKDHTTNRFGPVREVEHRLVVEIAFDSIHLSPRHKSGVAMRFPRVNLIRWDKPIEEADQLSDIKNLI